MVKKRDRVAEDHEPYCMLGGSKSCLNFESRRKAPRTIRGPKVEEEGKERQSDLGLDPTVPCLSFQVRAHSKFGSKKRSYAKVHQ
jgi:hypothetical protein